MRLFLLLGQVALAKLQLLCLLQDLKWHLKAQLKLTGQEIVGLRENDLSDVRRKNIGIVFQSFYLIPNLTAVENVLLSLEANQKYNRDEEAKSLLGEFGLSHRINHLPSELSGGEQQRVAIARALINKPKIILADEPTGNLDSANSESMMDLLFEYTKKSKTSLVMVTHDDSDS